MCCCFAKEKAPKKRGSCNGTRRTYRAAAHADGFFWGGVTKKKIRALFDITIVKAPAKLANPTEQARLLMTIQKLKRL